MGRNKKTSSKSAQTAKGETASVLTNIPEDTNGYNKQSCKLNGHCAKSTTIPKKCPQISSSKPEYTSSSQTAITDHLKSKKKKKKKEDDDEELQNLIDFIEGKDDHGKENAVPGNSAKTAKKKKKSSKSNENHKQNCVDNLSDKDLNKNSKNDDKCSVSKTDTKDSKGKDCKGKDLCQKKDSIQNGVKEDCVAKTKTKKPPKKATRPPTQEELEVMQLLQFIEGTNEDKKCAEKDSSDQNNNDSDNKKKRKKKKKKEAKEFDFNALKDNTHLEAKILEEILREPSCVAEHRLFNPKQVALLFSKGHNEHWEQFPECDGRLKALERSSEGLSLSDPGSKHLKLVIAELRRKQGKNITKRDLIDALKCHAYLHCEKCGYQSDIVVLQ